jgi:hypothetical protein
LKTEKILACDCERQVQNKKNTEQNRWSYSENQQQRTKSAASAKKMNKRVTRTKPAQRRQ